MLYHASKIRGMRTIEPHISTHGKAYVYAIRNQVTAVCFGAPKDDFDLLMDNQDGKTVLYECYPNAVERVYSGSSCSLYTIKEDGFLQGQTGWDEELVSENSVDVLQEQIIPDIYEYLLRATANEECKINLFSEDEEYISMLRDELSERIKIYGLSTKQMDSDWRFQMFLSKILNR